MEEKISDKIIRNTSYSIIGQVWGVTVALFLMPYIISHIGIERFGIWAIVGVLTGYFGLLDFGIGSSFIKYIAEYYTRKEYDRINQVVNTGLVFYSIFGVLIVVLGFLFVDILLVLFNIPSHLYSEARFVFLLGIAIFCISNALSSFIMVRDGLQRMDISNKVAIVMSVPNVIGVILFLELGYGLPGLIVNNAIILGLSSIVNFIIAFKILPSLRFNPRLFTGGILKELFKFGYNLQIAKIFGMISSTIDKLLITYFLSIGLVTFYQLGSSIVAMTRSILLLPVPVLLPAFSEINAKGEKEKLIEVYKRMVKYLSLIAIPVYTFIIVSAPQIMMVWMGDGYGLSVRIIQILASGYLCVVLGTGVGEPLLRGIGKPQYEMHTSLINIIINFPLSIILIIKFGFMGAAFGTMISWMVASIYYFIKLHQEICLPFSHFIRSVVLKPLVVCMTLGISLWGLTTLCQGTFLEPNRFTSLIVFIIQGLLFWGIYLRILFYIKPFDNIDSMILSRNIPRFLRHLIVLFSVTPEKGK